MKKGTKKRIMLIMLIVLVAVLTGCQRNTDANGNTLAEKVIYLTTPWEDMLDESFFTAIFVYPLSQCVNWLGTVLHSAVLGVIVTTVIYNIITLGLSVKSTVSTQKIQMLQPEMNAIQAKYAGRDDDNSKMQQAQEMQALYSKHGINPLGSLITPFLTFPILIAMYYAVQRADVVCNGTFLGIPLSTTPLAAFKDLANCWPIAVVFILMAITQFVSSKIPSWLAERKKKQAKNYRAYKDTNPQNTQTNMMMFTMVAMVVIIGIRWPAAMSVYWLINSLVNVLKTVYIQWRYIDHE
jgi:YidC/Oxa1 family membrane protein insertase